MEPSEPDWGRSSKKKIDVQDKDLIQQMNEIIRGRSCEQVKFGIFLPL